MSDPKSPTQNAGQRVTLPNRRRSETRKVSWRSPNNVDGPETKIHVTIGYADDGLRPVEIFYDAGYRTGSDMEVTVSEACILISKYIQHENISIDTFLRSLAEEKDLRTGSVGFASVFGVLLDQLNTPPAWAEEVSKHTGAS